MANAVYIVVPGAAQGGRIGLVKYGEKGYYQTDFDNAPVALEIVESVVKQFNENLGVPEEVVEAMHSGSMFGWHVPAAQAAHDYFKPVCVGRNDGIIEIKRFATLAEGEAEISRLESIDPDGIHAGEYYIDAPEEMVNPVAQWKAAAQAQPHVTITEAEAPNSRLARLKELNQFVMGWAATNLKGQQEFKDQALRIIDSLIAAEQE